MANDNNYYSSWLHVEDHISEFHQSPLQPPRLRLVDYRYFVCCWWRNEQ